MVTGPRDFLAPDPATEAKAREVASRLVEPAIADAKRAGRPQVHCYISGGPYRERLTPAVFDAVMRHYVQAGWKVERDSDREGDSIILTP